MKELYIVTGGSSGLGFAIAKKLLNQNKNVAIIGRQKNKLVEAEKILKNENNGSIIPFCGDVSNEKFVKEFYSTVSKEFIIKSLINCAGVGRFGNPENNNIEMINDVFSASLIGTILMSSNAINKMSLNGGTIINIMSSAALKGNATESIYCAAKWGARGFTEALKAYTKGSNIKVMGVYPGGMKSDFWNTDCGANPDTSKFMDVDEVAEQIIHSANKKNSMYVSDLSIERR